MENRVAKIQRFSKVVYTLMSIAFILCIVIGALEALAWLWAVLKYNTEIVTIGGVSVEAPLLFKWGDFKVLLPISWEPGFDLSGNLVSSSGVGFGDLMRIILTAVGLRAAKRVFLMLRENGSPFREDVVAALKRLAIALLCVGAVSGAIPLLAAGVVWALCLIFDYGCALQSERDTTL